jgi:hypothetical protein
MLAPANCSDSETFFKGSLWMPALTEPSSVAAAKTAPFMIATGGGAGVGIGWYGTIALKVIDWERVGKG